MTMTLLTWLSTHPVMTYFVFTFAISWGGVLIVTGGLTRMTGTVPQDDSRFPLVFIAMLAGPSLAGVLLTAIVGGGTALRELRSRLLKWRVDARWYALALLAAPTIATVVTFLLSLSSREFLPGFSGVDDKGAVFLLALVVGLAAGVLEELGWTGFAIPHLRQRHGVLATGLIVGVLWSAWHVLVTVWGIGDRAGTVPLLAFVLADGLAALPAFRVLMVCVYDRTESLFLAMLMHATLTATTLTMTPRLTGGRLLIYSLLFAGVLWVVIAAVMRSDRRRLPGRRLALHAA